MQAVLLWLGLIIAGLLVWVAALCLRQVRHNRVFHQESERGLGDRLEKALGYLRHRGEITANEYQALLGVSHSTAMRDLDALEEVGLVEQVGDRGRGVYYHVLKK